MKKYIVKSKIGAALIAFATREQAEEFIVLHNLENATIEEVEA